MIADESNVHLHALTELIETDRIQPLVSRTFPLREVPEAMRYLVEGRATGKIAIQVSE